MYAHTEKIYMNVYRFTRNIYIYIYKRYQVPKLDFLH